MLQTLQETFPSLAGLALDATRIVMVCDQNMNNRSSTGGKWLAVTMNKFRRRHHPTRTQVSWGAFYTGARPGPDAQDVRCMRERLKDPDMAEDAAMRVLEALDPDVPWLTEIDFLEALLAHVSFFHEELQKVSYSGISLQRLIVNIGTSSKFQWLLNDTRYRHAVDARELALLRSGIEQNYTFHGTHLRHQQLASLLLAPKVVVCQLYRQLLQAVPNGRVSANLGRRKQLARRLHE